MRQMVLSPRQPQPIPRAARRPRIADALLWLVRMLFVQPIGRRAREDRLGDLPDLTLRDIGLQRADLRAAAWRMVPLADVLPDYPSAGPLVTCGPKGCSLAMVRLSEAA